MSELVNNDGSATELEKPVSSQSIEELKFPPFPDPTDNDFDEDITEEERAFYLEQFRDLNKVAYQRLHCTACDRHLGNAVKNEAKLKVHPMLRTLVCPTCHSFYNSGEFDKGDDGSELYCRWCGQGGQVYCCSDCPHVFCAKCIKRNFGMPKIREIENTDDWKCFRCNTKCLWDLRAMCWALLRYCDLRNKMAFQCQDLPLKLKYAEANSIDTTECCKNVKRRREKKKEVENATKKIISKISPSIQVKKFASIIPEPEPQKRTQKRPASPKQRAIPSVPKLPIPIAPNPVPPPGKKIKLLPPGIPAGVPPGIPPGVINPVRFVNDKKISFQYTRMARPRLPIMPIVSNSFNGYGNATLYKNINNINSNDNDNINLSIESLTQGLDMSSMDALNNDPQDSNVVCTPDFPLEPLCEVTEDNDDDVECITPAPVATPKVNNPPPPLVPRVVTNSNIIQMTDNDVTVNAVTGGLKFRVDPQTLSSNKMYRLPDGRVFAINPNPNMPGGYSATIVSLSETTGKMAPKGETFAAKLSTVSTSSSSTPKTSKQTGGKSRRSNQTHSRKKKPNILRRTKAQQKQQRECDMKVPVEWYRYNLIDAIDALEYSLSRLETLKKDATTVHLRTRTVDEMKQLHRSLDNHLATSTKRFSEIRENLNKELKNYIAKKTKDQENSSDEDDDVLILPNENDNPIFIDEDSNDSVNENEAQEVDLTDTVNSESNDTYDKNPKDPLSNDAEPDIVDNTSKDDSIMDSATKIDVSDETVISEDSIKNDDDTKAENENKNEVESMDTSSIHEEENINKTNGECESKTVNEHEPEGKEENTEVNNEVDKDKTVNTEEIVDTDKTVNTEEIVDTDKTVNTEEINNDNGVEDKDTDNEENSSADKNNEEVNDSKETTKNKTDQSETQDNDMSEEMIEDLLKDEGTENNMTSINNCMDIFEESYP